MRNVEPRVTKSGALLEHLSQALVLAIGMLLALASPYLTIRLQNSGFLMIGETAMFAESSAFLVRPRDAISATILLVPACVAGVIAEVHYDAGPPISLRRSSRARDILERSRPGSLSSPVASRLDCRF